MTQIDVIITWSMTKLTK